MLATREDPRHRDSGVPCHLHRDGILYACAICPFHNQSVGQLNNVSVKGTPNHQQYY